MKISFIVAVALLAMANGLQGGGYRSSSAYYSDRGLPQREPRSIEEDHAAMGHVKRSTGEDHAAMGHVKRSIGEDHAAMGHVKRSIGEDHATIGHDKRSVSSFAPRRWLRSLNAEKEKRRVSYVARRSVRRSVLVDEDHVAMAHFKRSVSGFAPQRRRRSLNAEKERRRVSYVARRSVRMPPVRRRSISVDEDHAAIHHARKRRSVVNVQRRSIEDNDSEPRLDPIADNNEVKVEGSTLGFPYYDMGYDSYGPYYGNYGPYYNSYGPYYRGYMPYYERYGSYSNYPYYY